MNAIRLGNRSVGDGLKTYVIAEIGINHNGSIELAKRLIDGAAIAGCDAVKFQKRTPELCVPREQWAIERDTPWGRISYIDYRRKMEFGRREFEQIEAHCREKEIGWFASCWDEPSVEFLSHFDVPCIKAASASLTDHELLRAMRKSGLPVMLSTGMSTIDEIDSAVRVVGEENLLLAHSTSSYPCPLADLNLRMIHSLKAMYPRVPIGYSGHETGLAPTWAAVSMGATFIERHITLDRSMWGTDQSASVEIVGLIRLVANIRDIDQAKGDGVKRVTAGEVVAREKLRRVRPDLETRPS
jgi:N-acetylneuraminate synthase